MLQRRTLIAAAVLLVAAAPVRGADAPSANDTARFLAGMQPSADSPLVPLTKDPSWQHHAKFFDGAFAQLEEHFRVLEAARFLIADQDTPEMQPLPATRIVIAEEALAVRQQAIQAACDHQPTGARNQSKQSPRQS